MPDEMTPLERFSLLLIDESPDRLIAAPLVTAHAATVAGLAPGDCLKDGKLFARAQLEAQALYGHDAFTVFSDVGILAEAMGSVYRHFADGVPLLETPVVGNPDDLDGLRPPEPDQGRLPVYLEAIRILHQTRGDRVPTFCFVPAPFTTAAGLRGIEDFLVDTVTDPEFALQIVRVAEAAAIPLLDEIVLAGALPVLVDPLASSNVASPATYRKFALPGTKRLIERLHRLDLDVTLHVCGDTAPILADLAATGADLLSFDQTPIGEVRERIGDRVRLVGNVSPQTLLQGDRASVERETAAAMRAGIGTPKGFVLSTGCELAIWTPEENVVAFMKAARAAGSRS
jgi:uroporphyrinogen decarboxylase